MQRKHLATLQGDWIDKEFKPHFLYINSEKLQSHLFSAELSN